MVHWVFSTFGKHPVVSRHNSLRKSILGSDPPPVAEQGTRHIIKKDGQHNTVILSPKKESKRDSDLNSQRASAGSSTLNTRSRAQTAESSQPVSHNLQAIGAEVAAPAPAHFYARDAIEVPRRGSSLDFGAGNEPRPSWPLPESMISGSSPPSISSAPNTPTGMPTGFGIVSHRRSLSNSSRRRAPSVRVTRSSQDLARSSSERMRRSQEHVRSHSRAGTVSPFPRTEVAGPSSPIQDHSSNEHLISHQSSGQPLISTIPEQDSPPRPKTAAPESLIHKRTSSRRAPTITSESANLRDVDPSKAKGKARSSTHLTAESSRAQEARQSTQAFLSPRASTRSSTGRPPGSRGKDPDATALPRFLYNQSNLEEQLEAARIMQVSTPPVSLASGKSSTASRLATELYTISYLIFFSIMGTLARLGLQALTFYPGAPIVTSVLWPNFAGSFILGFLAEDRRLFREEWGSHKPETPSFDPEMRDLASPTSEKFYFANRRGHRDEDQPSQVVSHGRVKKTIPLFIGLASGLCGSMTTFSAFMRDSFLTLSNELPTPVGHTYPQGFTIPAPEDTIPRNPGYSVMSVIAAILLTVCMSIGGLRFGAHFAMLLDPILPTFRFSTFRRFIDPAFVLLGWTSWIGAVVMCIWPPDRPGGPQSLDGTWVAETWRGQALFACAFVPAGCLLRFYISLFLNAYSGSFPLGTFAVNIFGTAVEGMVFDLQRVRIVNSLVGGGRVPCQVLQGLQDGFCGSLSVISTWVAELNGLKRHHAYIYGLSSIIGGLGLMVAIMGSVLWTVGWSNPVCSA